MSTPATAPAHDVVGPSVNDPLTPDELSILLALPRAAQKSPDSLFVRLPKGATPSEGHIDVSCSQACSIVARLASAWRARTHVQLGPGTTVCLMINPYVHGIFHHLALWALGCTVQYIAVLYGDEMVDAQLEQSGCKLVIHLGSTGTWFEERRAKHPEVEMVVLDESEYANTLAAKESSGLGPAPEWPTPKRPSPAVVIQSSSTTSIPKLLSFSLHFYTFNLPADCRQHLASQPPSFSSSPKAPQVHPRLIASAPFWQIFHIFLLTHLVAGTPFTLVPTPELFSLSVHELAEWIKELDVGGMVSAPFKVRDLLLNDDYTELLQSMYSISMGGSVVDEQLSDLVSRKGIKASNMLGMSELGTLLTADRPPFTHFRPDPNFPPPLSIPVSEALTQPRSATDPAKRPPSREVQLWYLVSQCPQLAHVASHRGVPLKLEPFPGPGPHNGELALNFGDIFREFRSGEGEDEDVVYVHAGRMDDYLRLSDGDLDISASLYETELQTLVRTQLAKAGEGGWRFDAAQLFGVNLPKTALVVQLLGDHEAGVGDETMKMIRQCVDEANDRLGLNGGLRIDPVKRMLVTTRTPDGTVGAGELCLSLTHKKSLRRWKNVTIFGDWLNQLDWS